jgi:outer membrane lipoprotein carrier protein
MRLLDFCPQRRAVLSGLILAATLSVARADSVDTLRQFLRETPSGQGSFTQTITAPDGVRQKVSSGRFEYQRPLRFRFNYLKPYEQLIVSDGSKVWIYDPDLQQASSRKLGSALDSSPAALLAGGEPDKDFVLKAEGARNGLEWVQAQPRNKDGTVRDMRVGFRGKDPVTIEVTDNLGQRTVLQISAFQGNVALPRDNFVFKPPPGVDLVEQ